MRIRQVAWQTFANFFFLIMFAFVFLVPGQTPIGVTLPLFVICTVAIGITISQALRARSSGMALPTLLTESLPSLTAYLGMIAVIVLLLKGNMQGLVWLLPIVVVLLGTAVRNAWALLVTIQQQ